MCVVCEYVRGVSVYYVCGVCVCVWLWVGVGVCVCVGGCVCGCVYVWCVCMRVVCVVWECRYVCM